MKSHNHLHDMHGFFDDIHGIFALNYDIYKCNVIGNRSCVVQKKLLSNSSSKISKFSCRSIQEITHYEVMDT